MSIVAGINKALSLSDRSLTLTIKILKRTQFFLNKIFEEIEDIDVRVHDANLYILPYQKGLEDLFDNLYATLTKLHIRYLCL